MDGKLEDLQRAFVCKTVDGDRTCLSCSCLFNFAHSTRTSVSPLDGLCETFNIIIKIQL